MKIGVVATPGNDSKQLPSNGVSYHGKEGDAVPWYPYGLHAVAEEQSYVLIISVNGNSEERICIPTSMLKRPALVPGEVALFHPPTGTLIKLDNAGNVQIEAKGEVQVTSPTLVKITTPLVEIEGDLDVSGNVGIGIDLLVTGETTLTDDVTIVSEEVTSGGIYIGSRHEHPENTGDGFTEGPVDNG